MVECFAARNNIGVVVALWAPIILVRVYNVTASILLLLSVTSSFNSFAFYFRYTLWIPKFGMPYSQHYLVGFMVHFVALGRLADFPLLWLLILWFLLDLYFSCLFVVFIFGVYLGVASRKLEGIVAVIDMLNLIPSLL